MAGIESKIPTQVRDINPTAKTGERMSIEAKQRLLLVLVVVVATGCGGFSASKSVSPMDFLMPGLHIRNYAPAPNLPGDTNAVPELARAN